MTKGRSKLAVRSVAVLLMIVLSFSMASIAQVSAARLSGTVTDPSGATLIGAKVEITNIATNVAREVTTNASGLYNAPGIPPGTYSVVISAAGFSSEVRKSVVLNVGGELVLNASLKVGGVSEQIVVSDAPPNVDLTSSALSGLVEGKNVRELPLNGRSWTDLASLTPGVNVIQTQPPITASDRPKRGLGGQLSISGGRPQQNSYLLDGININDYSNAGPGSVLGGNLGVDAIQEFQVITTNPMAQYGRTSGGVISGITRSGTNKLHGSAYEFVRNSALDAKGYFETGPKLPFKRNQFGGTLGGPIRKDKTFIFGDYEGVRQNLSQEALSPVPTADARAGRFADGTTATPDPAVARFINAFYPLPTDKQPITGDVSNYAFPSNQTTSEDFFTVKADQSFSSKDSLAVSYLYDNSPVRQNDELNNKIILSKTRRQTVSILETHLFSSSTLNSAHIGFNRDNAGSPYSAIAVNKAVSDTSFGFVPGADAGQVQVGGLVTFSGGLSSANPLLFRWNSYQAYDDVSHTVGKNTFEFGGNVEVIRDNQFSADTPGGFFQFDSVEKFVLNQPTSLLATIPGTITPRHLRQTIYGAYFQDDLRLRPNLTINMAVRYEGSTIPFETNGKLSNLRVPSGNTPFLGNPYLANPTHRNFEPRIGFAWDPFKDSKTSVRGGFGIYDILPLIVELGSGVDAAFPFAQNVSGANLPAGTFPTQAYNIIANNPSDHRPYVIRYNPPRNYVMQWNVNVQREIVPNTTAMLAYVGSRGIHMWYQTDDGNIVLPTKTSAGYLWPGPIGSGTVIDPLVGRFLKADWTSDSYFHGLEAQLNQKVAHSLQGQLSYTWSRCIDTSSGSAASDQYRNSLAATLWTDPRTHRGPCDTNITHNLSLNAVWDVPHPAGLHGLAGWATSGWQVSGIFHASSGQPFSLSISGDPLGLNSAVPFDFPDRLRGSGCSSLVNSGTTLGYDPVTQKEGYLKVHCFALPTAKPAIAAQCVPFGFSTNPPNPGIPGTCANLLGNGGRNELIGPGLLDTNFSIYKNTPMKRISETANLQFRAQIYNIFNHPNFSPPNDNSTLYDGGSGNLIGGAGAITQTTIPSRQIEFAVKLTF